jgi:hypothetical protein
VAHAKSRTAHTRTVSSIKLCGPRPSPPICQFAPDFFYKFKSLKHNPFQLCSSPLMPFYEWIPHFWELCRLLTLNKNNNNNRNNKNENGKIIWKWKQKWFGRLPIVFEKYHIFSIFYRILPIEIPYSRTHPCYLHFQRVISIFLESWPMYPNSNLQSSWPEFMMTMDSFIDDGINI